MDVGTVLALAGFGLPIAAGLGKGAIWWVRQPLQTQQDAHEAKDALIHAELKESSGRVEGKLDLILEKLIHP